MPMNMTDKFDSLVLEWARSSRAADFAANQLNDEMEGQLILRHGNRDICVAVLDAIREIDCILNDNEIAGRYNLDINHIPKSLDNVIAEHGDHFFNVLSELREDWGLGYEGYGFDYLEGAGHYEAKEAEWKSQIIASNNKTA